jgi:hypothetical protein
MKKQATQTVTAKIYKTKGKALRVSAKTVKGVRVEITDPLSTGVGIYTAYADWEDAKRDANHRNRNATKAVHIEAVIDHRNNTYTLQVNEVPKGVEVKVTDDEGVATYNHEGLLQAKHTKRTWTAQGWEQLNYFVKDKNIEYVKTLGDNEGTAVALTSGKLIRKGECLLQIVDLDDNIRDSRPVDIGELMLLTSPYQKLIKQWTAQLKRENKKS